MSKLTSPASLIILSTIAEHGEILTTKICEATGLAQNTAAQILRAAESEGLIVRVRTTKVSESGGKRYGVLEYRNCCTAALLAHLSATPITIKSVSGRCLAIHNDVYSDQVRQHSALLRKIMPVAAMQMGGAA